MQLFVHFWAAIILGDARSNIIAINIDEYNFTVIVYKSLQLIFYCLLDDCNFIDSLGTLSQSSLQSLMTNAIMFPIGLGVCN